MPYTSVKTASSALLSSLNQLSSFPHCKAETKLPALQKVTLDEHRENIDILSKQLDQCYRATAILRYSLDQVQKIKSNLTDYLTWQKYHVNELIAAKPSSVHLPNEVLCLISKYVYLNPISVETAVQLASSWCKWDKIVLGNSFIRVDENSIESPSLISTLSISTPSKLVIDLERSLNPELAIQALLPFRGRWHSLTVIANSRGEIFSPALFAVPCPNCSLPIVEGRYICEDHTILSALSALTIRISRWVVPSFLGLLKNINHLSLLVATVDIDEIAINFSGLETEAPLITELTITWQASTYSEPPGGVYPKAYLPNLRRVVYIYHDEENSGRLNGLQFAFGSLRGDLVEDVCARILGPVDGDEEAILEFLEEIFPSTRSLSLQAQPDTHIDDPSSNDIHDSQMEFLEFLVPSENRAIFPKITHLSLELDQTEDGLEALLAVLHRRHDHRGPLVHEIQTLDLYTKGHRRLDTFDFFCRVHACVQRLTVFVVSNDLEGTA